MLRALSGLRLERQALEALAAPRLRRDVFKVFRAAAHATPALAAADPLGGAHQTVLTKAGPAPPRAPPGPPAPPAAPGRGPAPPAAPPPPQQPPQQPPRRAWTLAAAALALTASLGGAYFYRKMSDIEPDKEPVEPEARRGAGDEEPGELYPASGALLPERVEFLIVGAGTAAFAALRALRAARPDAALLLAGAERAPPYMRPPLSKELWRREDLAAAAADPAALTFTQWNGKRRRLAYEPLSFYTPVEKLREGAAGAALARGWRVTALDLAARRATLEAPGQPPASVAYDKCLLATGSEPKRLAALAPAAAAGRALTLHTVRDAARAAALLDAPDTRTVVIVGAGLLAAELAAALAERLRGSGKRLVQVYRERAPLQELLPGYLAADAARRLAAMGVEQLAACSVTASEARAGRVALRLARADGSEAALEAELVLECVGAEPAVALAAAAGLELDAARGGVLVNAELLARAGVWAAGDAACFHDVLLGRRRVAHHDHAVLSGRRAAANMAGDRAPEPYTHQSMFWSDLGPALGYEAIGIIDSELPTVGVFAEEAVSDVGAGAAAEAGAAARAAADAGAEATAEAGAEKTTAPAMETSAVAAAAPDAESKRYERGVVFYLRDQRVVGVLLWNLFNRMHVARQVLTHGEFDDLFEVAKLFAPHEDD